MAEHAIPSPTITHPPKIENPKFFQLLESADIIDGSFIRDLLAEFDGNALDVLATLIQSGVGTKRQLCQLWCDSIGIAHVDLEKTLFQSRVVCKIPERIARLYYAIPVYQMGEMITVATATPDNAEIAAAIEALVGGPVSLVFALPQDIETAIENEYRTGSALIEFFNKIAAGRLLRSNGVITVEILAAAAGSEAINQLHVALVLYGIMENAGELRLVAGIDEAAVEFISDRRQIDQIRMEKAIYDQLLIRLKSLAGVNLTFDNRPQFGRILLPAPGRRIDIRFESQPAEYGETIVLRFSGPRQFDKITRLGSLNLSHRIISGLKARLRSPKGLFLLAGPANSGKSTLAYAILHQLKASGRKIQTVENRIKFLLPGIDQHQVNPDADLTSAEILTACLKKHPDALYLQHLDHPDLMEPVSEAALSGRFVIAGIEAQNAASAIELLGKLGGGAAVGAILTQHLAARLCDHCRQRFRIPQPQVRALFTGDENRPIHAWREKGCPYCRHSGFSGRIGIHELLIVDNRIRKKIINRAPIEEISSGLGPDNYYSMRYDGMKKVLRGLTTFDEIDRLPSGFSNPKQAEGGLA